MIEEKAVIVETRGGVAWVETRRQSACATCQVNKACGTATLHKVLGQKRTRLQVMNPRHFGVGETVVLGLQENALVRGSLILYALPLLAMFGVAVIGYVLFFLAGYDYSEGFKILFSLLGLMSGFFWVSKYSKKMSNDPDFQAVILSNCP
ncbi:MAG TPA: Fis family transcriptional regulator [Gammaproteobacteria bacterium]|nr:Fis family transcriptional regulator [Gammaproteobacteria bacterium]